MNLKSLFGFFLLSFTFLWASAQSEEVFSVVEEMPRFPGCELLPEEQINKCAQAKLFNFIRRNTIFPKDAYEAGLSGRSIVQFTVNKDGSLGDFKLPKPGHPSFDAEALRIVKAMPYWRPGKQKGKLVKVRFTLPISFKFQIVKEKFSSISDLFCEKYIAEILPATKLQKFAQSTFENTDICGVNGMTAKLAKITLTHTVGEKDVVLESLDGNWTPQMNKILSNVKTGESIALDYIIEYQIGGSKSFTQEEYRAIVAK